MATASLTPDETLAEFVGQFYADPLGFVMAAYPWGEPGSALEKHTGPDVWQAKFLKELGEEVARNGFNGKDPVRPIRRAVSSGHGIGKSTLVAWVVDWIMSTRPHAQGTITANTFTQLETKTWAALKRWTALCITAHWFKLSDNRMYHVNHKDSWFCAPQSSKEENSESFAGQHAADSTSFYVLDEASAIARAIYEVAEGGLTDGEPMIFLLGNPTRNNGNFYDAVFGRERSRWNPEVIDSRTSRFTNKAEIKEWEETYGEDSDFFRVRVRGIAPRANDSQYIDQDRVTDAQKRDVVVFPDEPLVAGVDFAWGGADDNVVRFRRGLDARSIPPVRVKGEFTRDPGVMTTRLADILTKDYGGQRVKMLFLDSAGIAGPIARRLRDLGYENVQEVNFGADSPDIKFRFFRDYMWGQMKDWLAVGAIDKHPELEADLVGPGTRPDPRQRVWLESKEDMKKRGVDSPDDGDALALTFAAPVGRPEKKRETTALPRTWAWS